MRKRFEIIKQLINRHGYTRYLEIGVGKGKNFNKINCLVKHSIDPEYPATFVMTSDKFFKELDDSERYDIIFIDGDHSKRAVMRDIYIHFIICDISPSLQFVKPVYIIIFSFQIVFFWDNPIFLKPILL